MNFKLNPDEQAFKEDVYRFLEEEVTEEMRRERESYDVLGQNLKILRRKLGKKGLLGLHWPKEYGGQSRPFLFSFIVHEALGYFGVDYLDTGLRFVAPTILLFGSEEQKKAYLPPIAQGEVEFALGYTEPGAGSDLAAMEMRAEDKGDHFLINGQKTFNSVAHEAEYHWLAARTDPFATPKHRGISMFIVDLKSPGITVRPLWLMGGSRVNEVFYDDVKVPRENLVGEENRGFYQMSKALDLERSLDAGALQGMFQCLVKYTQENHLNNNHSVRRELAERAIEVEIARLLSWNVACKLNKEIIPDYEASACKVFVSEAHRNLVGTGMSILGLYGMLVKGSAWTPLEGWLSSFCQRIGTMTVAGGANEIQRSIIATRGLGLPR